MQRTLSFQSISLVFIVILSCLGVPPNASAEDVQWHSAKTSARHKDQGIYESTFRTLSEKLLDSIVSIQVVGPLHIHSGPKGNVHPSKSRGSGFVLHESGYLISNYHVIDDSSAIQVTFHSGVETEATVVAFDKQADIALLKISPGDLELKPVTLGDSDSVRVGDWVMAIGNPMSLSHSVSTGIISALNRDTIKPRKEHRYSQFLQLDAAINKGSSGGPLFNIRGEVIGMNTAIKRKGQGLAFAIPSNMITRLLPKFKKGGFVHSWLGVSLRIADYPVEDKQRSAVQVAKVQDESPAKKAGFLENDFILSIDEKKVETTSAFSWLTGSAGVGSVVTIQIFRPEIGTLTLTPLLAENPEKKKKPKAPYIFFNFSDIQKNWGVEILEKEGRLVVEKVDVNSPAEKAGMQVGDQITGLPLQETLNRDGLLRTVIRAKKSHILELEFLRNGRRYYAPILGID